ncbi:MAG: hypothetical protein QW332_06140 [Thermoproteota archaeon]
MSEKTKQNTKKVFASIDEALWERLWNYIKARYPSPWRKLSLVMREAIIEYLEKHENETKGVEQVNELQEGS